MRRLLSPGLAVIFLIWAIGSAGYAAWQESPTAPTADAPATNDDPGAVLERGLDKERARNWSGAMEIYHERPRAMAQPRGVQSPTPPLRDPLQAATPIFGHQLPTKFCSPLPQEQATELYDEVLERIENNYVDTVPFEPLVRHGLDNLEVALRDPVFLKANAPAAEAERVTWLREVLREHRANLVIPDRTAAIRMAQTCGDLGRQAIGLATTPVLLEFTYGACDALDDFTSYLTPDKLEDLYAMIDGNFVGLGIELKLDKEGLRLIGVIRGGPAWEAGLKPGDQIVRVGSTSLKGLGLDESANRLQGTEGSTVELGVRRRDGSLHNYHLVRRHVEVESVAKAKIVEPGGEDRLPPAVGLPEDLGRGARPGDRLAQPTGDADPGAGSSG